MSAAELLLPDPVPCEVCGKSVYSEPSGYRLDFLPAGTEIARMLAFRKIDHPECEGQLFIIREAKYLAEKAELEREEHNKNFLEVLSIWQQKYKVPHQWQLKTFENFQLHEKVKHAYSMAGAWDPRDEAGLIFMGGSGTGKSHLAWAIVNRTLKDLDAKMESHLARFPVHVNIAEFLNGVRQNNFDLPAWVDNAALVVLDDLGVENITDWSREVIFRFLERRIACSGRVIITTNLTLNEMRDRLHERITSRILELCVPVKVEGDDRRLQKMKNYASELQARAERLKQ